MAIKTKKTGRKEENSKARAGLLFSDMVFLKVGYRGGITLQLWKVKVVWSYSFEVYIFSFLQFTDGFSRNVFFS